jgi:hypothetical protein
MRVHGVEEDARIWDWEGRSNRKVENNWYTIRGFVVTHANVFLKQIGTVNRLGTVNGLGTVNLDWARSTFFKICYLCYFFVIHVVLLLIVMFYVFFMCKCVLPPRFNPIAVDKYININIKYYQGHENTNFRWTGHVPHNVRTGMLAGTRGRRSLSRPRWRWENSIKPDI